MTSPGPQLVGASSADTHIADATAVACFAHEGGRTDFEAWSVRVHRAASAAPGYLSGRVGIVDAPEFDWSISYTFDTEENLHRWLDGEARRELLAEGRALGFHSVSPDVVVVDGQPPGTGIAAFTHAVMAGKEAEFIATERTIVALSASFPGFEGATVVAPANGSDRWLSMLRFRTDRQLLSWMNSDERQRALPALRAQLTDDFSVITQRTPFGSILRMEEGVTKVTPNWKSAMLVLLVLYPTVMTLSRFLGPVLDRAGAEPWLSMWLSQIVSVGLMTWLLMPAVTGWFRRWLDPVQGSGLRITLLGALVVVVIYAATLALFASVTWLQFWAHPD